MIIPDTPEMRQTVFALQAKLAMDSFELLHDFSAGGYKQMTDNAKQQLFEAYPRINVTLAEVIHYNMVPILKNRLFPFEAVLNQRWEGWSG